MSAGPSLLLTYIGIMPALNPVQSRRQRVDVGVGVVERKRRAHRAFQPETAQNWLRAVMARTHRDAFLIERRADPFALLAVQDEGDDPCLLGCRTNERRPGGLILQRVVPPVHERVAPARMLDIMVRALRDVPLDVGDDFAHVGAVVFTETTAAS